MNVNNNEQNRSDDVIVEETRNPDETTEVFNNKSLQDSSEAVEMFSVREDLVGLTSTCLSSFGFFHNSRFVLLLLPTSDMIAFGN